MSRTSSNLDQLDQKLIALLRKNARMSVADLAHKLGVSRGTVTNRVRKLEDQQVILGYTIRLRPEAKTDRIHAWMGVLVEGNQGRKVIASLLGEPGVASLHDTNGRWDLLAELEVGSMAELSQVLERVRLISGIRSTEVSGRQSHLEPVASCNDDRVHLRNRWTSWNQAKRWFDGAGTAGS